MEANWEQVCGDDVSSYSSRLDRMEVPGGWLYRSLSRHLHYTSAAAAVALTFVPNPQDSISGDAGGGLPGGVGEPQPIHTTPTEPLGHCHGH